MIKQALFVSLVLGAGGVAAAADVQSLAAAAGLSLDVSASQLAAVQQPEAQPKAEPTAEPAAPHKPSFAEFTKGQETVWFLTVGAGVAGDSDPGTHYQAYAAWSTFIGKELEVQLIASGWYFNQPPDSTGGAGFTVNLRWHFWHGAYGGESGWGGSSAGNDWTVYVDAGIGLIVSGDDVPPGGSSVNFAPQAGIGFTARLGESTTRLVGGLAWHHMSNARFNGDSNNPDFNAPMLYVGLEWPL